MPYTQDQINSGQARINYELVEVDDKMIGVLKEILEILKDVVAAQPTASHMKKVDFSRLEKALEAAHKANIHIADIKPPGCQPPSSPPTYPG